MTLVSLVHLSDMHFGVQSDAHQVARLGTLVSELAPSAVVVSGDLTQRARHREFQQAKAFVGMLARQVPVFVVPGNHDVAWWTSPFGLLGRERIYSKYQQYFGDDLRPSLTVPGAVLVGVLSSHGVAVGSVTWNLRDLAVKGHLPFEEIERATAVFQSAPAESLKVLVLHHNVLPGPLSGRVGLARLGRTRRRILETGADLVLCGHDHQESIGQLGDTTVVSTAGTHTSRTRGKRSSAFNLITADARSVAVRHLRWDPGLKDFRPGDEGRFARSRVEGSRMGHAVS